MSATTTISTHVLDTAFGIPASGVDVTFERVASDGTTSPISHGTTNTDGRVSQLVPADSAITPGTYRLTFDVVAYFAETRRQTFYQTIRIEFEVGAEPQHYHVPLLLSPFGYSTYRGS